MTAFWYALIIAIGAISIYLFISVLRRTSNQYRHPDVDVPEIPTQLPTEPEPPKVFLDPLVMQMHSAETEAVLFVSAAGIETEVLVNKSAALIFKEAGWAPFRATVKQWAESPAYCRCGPRFGGAEDEMGELALAYLYGELLGDAQFDQAFDELDDYWYANAEKFGYNKPKRDPAFDYSQPGC